MTASSVARPARRPVVLSYGLGADSTAILLRWLEDPSSRDFDLQDLIVLTAMVGDEFEETGRLVREHILPRLRAFGVRFVQVARAGAAEADGLVVLSDTRAPTELYLGGAHRLSDELAAAGTVPQFAGEHKCSLKFKAWVLDTWLERELGGRPFRHVMGFELDETSRWERDAAHNTGTRTGEYPLVEWGWDRERLQAFIASVVGVRWAKSCCVFCPYMQGKDECVARLLSEPRSAEKALRLEAVSRALNPASQLYKAAALVTVVRAARGGQKVADAADAALRRGPWAVYRVRRVMLAPGRGARETVRLTAPQGHGAAHAALEDLAHGAGVAPVEEAGAARAWIRRRGASYPAIEEMLVAAPAVVAEKARSYWPALWAEALWAVEGAEALTPVERALARGLRERRARRTGAGRGGGAQLALAGVVGEAA